MKMTKERKYVISLTLVFILLIIACAISFILGFVDMSEKDTLGSNIFELIYMTFHAIVLLVGLAFCIAHLKGNNYHIMRNLMYQEGYHQVSRTAIIIASILSGIGFLTGTYFALVLCGVPLPYLNFPIMLRLILVNTPFTVFIVGLFFIFYPLVYKK